MKISILYLDHLPFWKKDWTISDIFYDEWKMTLVLNGNFHSF